MRFCEMCSSVMTKSTSSVGVIVFQCRCGLTEDGKPDDTMMYEEYLETAESNLKHDVFIENSSHDDAAHIVLKDCPGCGLNFLTMIRIGKSESCMYTCTCDYRATQDEYMRTVTSKSYKSATEPEEAKKLED